MQLSHIFRHSLAIGVFFCGPFYLLADDTVYTKVDVNPIPQKTPPPDYPEQLKRSGVSGVVAVTIIIDETGKVISSNVVKSSNPDFNEAALTAVKKWKFKPGIKDGQPVKIRVTFPIKFSLED